MIDSARFAYWMGIFSDTYGRPLTTPTYAAWHRLLSQQLTTQEFEAGCSLCLQELRFWPKPAEIVQHGKMRRDMTLAATETFNDLMRWCGREQRPYEVARERLPAFALRAFNAVGGPGRFRSLLVEDEPFLRKEFVAAYTAAAQDQENDELLSMALKHHEGPRKITGPESVRDILKTLPGMTS